MTVLAATALRGSPRRRRPTRANRWAPAPPALAASRDRLPSPRKSRERRL